MRSPAILPGGFLEAASELVRRKTGLVFSETRRSGFQAAFARTMQRAGAAEPERYLHELEFDPTLLDDLVAEITVGETYFFREPRQFQVIRNTIVPDLLGTAGRDQRLRIWSAGCATGEEPYTIAIVLGEMGLESVGHIVATDLSRVALARAAQARYSRWSLRGMPEQQVQAYFDRNGERFSLRSPLREAVDFRYLNLAEDSCPSPATGVWGMDLILCRNVLIYFDAETVARVARRLMDSLSKGGWLLLGASDPPLARLVPCAVVVTEAGLAYRHAQSASTASEPTAVAWSPAIPRRATEPEPDVSLLASSSPRPLLPEAQAGDDAMEATRCYAERDYGRAASVAERAVLRDPEAAAVWIVWVRALANRGDLPAAGRACAAAIDRHRTVAELVYLHAVLLGEAGQHAAAAAAARQALYLDAGLAVAHLTLAGALTRLGEIEGARRAFRNAERLLVALSPDAPVPASDGEPAARLLEMVRVQMRLAAPPI